MVGTTGVIQKSILTKQQWLKISFSLLFNLSIVMINAGCAEVLLLNALTAKKSDDKPITNIGDLTKVTKENYLSGEAFCEEYNSITALEHGKKVEAPMYYDQSGLTTKIYAWTQKPFNPKLPSVLLFDGGPGQNLHGMADSTAASGVNFIHLDQRGLGCSAPATFEVYKDAKFYSSKFIIQDADLVRKAFGIDKWTVYGVSYGSVLATMYANQFPTVTRAAILEGVYYDGADTHATKWKVEKLNLVMDDLSKAQRSQVFKIISGEDSDARALILHELNSIWYSESGLKNYEVLLKDIISPDGELLETRVESRIGDLETEPHSKTKPQKPMGNDTQFYLSILCQDLSDWLDNKSELGIDKYADKFVATTSKEDPRKECQNENIPFREEGYYVAKNYPVNVPMYYFQGTHDGATLAIGALKHWKSVPQSSVTMMLNQRGGHNPFLTDLYLDMITRKRESTYPLKQKYMSSNIQRLSKNAKIVFENAVNAKPMLQSQVDDLNQDEPANEKWLLYGKAPQDMANIEKELKGVKMMNFGK